MNWININEKLPEIAKAKFVSTTIIFACNDNTVDAGNYHTNGCFYGIKTIARTVIAERKYPLSKLPDKIATHWMPMPKFP